MLRRDLRRYLLGSMVMDWPIFIPQALNPLGLMLLILRDRMSWARWIYCLSIVIMRAPRWMRWHRRCSICLGRAPLVKIMASFWRSGRGLALIVHSILARDRLWSTKFRRQRRYWRWY